MLVKGNYVRVSHLDCTFYARYVRDMYNGGIIVTRPFRSFIDDYFFVDRIALTEKDCYTTGHNKPLHVWGSPSFTYPSKAPKYACQDELYVYKYGWVLATIYDVYWTTDCVWAYTLHIDGWPPIDMVKEKELTLIGRLTEYFNDKVSKVFS